jgi:hypothetical protein
MKNNDRYTQKQFKEIVIGSTYYHNNKNEDTYVYNVKTMLVENWNNRLIASGQSKNKLTMLSVPSTRNIHAESWIKQMTFHITNRINVQFVTGVNTNKFYKINIIYNHEKNVDVNSVVKSLMSAFKHFAE